LDAELGGKTEQGGDDVAILLLGSGAGAFGIASGFLWAWCRRRCRRCGR